jgi:hypothetical protein
MSAKRNKKSVRESPQFAATALATNHMDTNISGSDRLAIVWDADLPIVRTPYLQTAQAQEGGLIDYHARTGVAEVKERLNTLETRVGEVESTLEGLGVRLDQVSGVPRESVSKTLSDLLRDVAAVRATYVSPTSDGYQVILTYPDSMPLVDFLRAVVPLEIEIDKRYKNVYFDFEHVPESGFSIRSFPDAKPLQ